MILMLKNACLVVDSSSSLPHSAIERYGICEIPFYYKFGSGDYLRENVDGSTDDFYRHMENDPSDLPHTAAPNIYDWLNVIEERYAQGMRRFILMTISSALSSSYQTASSAKQMMEERHTDVKVEAVNANTCACGLAAFELAVAKLVDAGRPYEEIVSAITAMKDKVVSLFSVRDLTYMRAGGRIGGATAFIGQLVCIKPVCAFVGGVVKPVRAVPGRKKALKFMVDHAISKMEDPMSQVISVQNAMFPEDAQYILDYFRSRTGYSGEIFSSDLGIVVGSHSGPGAIGIGFVRDPLIGG
jgi:DegV family protein with EDD domain